MKQQLTLYALFCITTSVLANYSGTCGSQLTWRLTTTDSTLTIRGTGAMKYYYLNVPWYNYRSYIKNICLPNGLTWICNGAFCNCSNLTSVTIPKTVISIGDEAFYGCTNLTSINIPKNVTNIGYSAFFGCRRLTSIIIPENVTNIDKSAFRYCTSLTSVTWNAKNCTDFSDGNNHPFYNCSITAFTFGTSVKRIPAYLCYSMKGLTSISIPDGVTNIGKETFCGCTNLNSISIPNSVTSIGKGAFYGCTRLVSLRIRKKQLEKQQ